MIKHLAPVLAVACSLSGCSFLQTKDSQQVSPEELTLTQEHSEALSSTLPHDADRSKMNEQLAWHPRGVYIKKDGSLHPLPNAKIDSLKPVSKKDNDLPTIKEKMGDISYVRKAM